LYKLLFIEWLLEINIAIGRRILNIQSRMKAEQYIENNEELDMRIIPPVVKRGIILDEAILNERWNLCKGCEHLTESNQCDICNCFMRLKCKFSWSKCPIDKWGKYKQKDMNGSTVIS
tara:strand:- start:134 stop:487 length:354 start_codon:yes stop_codon:yes gene_type:complete